jgi:hypothetical protein
MVANIKNVAAMLGSMGLCFLTFGNTEPAESVSVGFARYAEGGARVDGGLADAATLPAISAPNWVLQLPTGEDHSPTTISSLKLPGYSSDYYYQAPDGGQIFMVPAKGITTKGSKHCRTEMRESTSSGGQAAWSAFNTNRMTVTGKVIQVGGGSKGSVTIGQVFNGSDSIPLAELEYSTCKKGFVLLYEEAKSKGKLINLKTPVSLGSKYTFEMALTDGVLKITINGTTVCTRKPSSPILKKKFYFKYGNYDQTTTCGSPSTTPYTIVDNYSVSVVHRLKD